MRATNYSNEQVIRTYRAIPNTDWNRLNEEWAQIQNSSCYTPTTNTNLDPYVYPNGYRDNSLAIT